MRDHETVPRLALAPGYDVPRLINGTWQLSQGHGQKAVRRDEVFAAMSQRVRAGFDAFDCADIYTGVEALLGDFLTHYRQRHGAAAARQIRVHTKFVPDRAVLAKIRRADVEKIIDRSLARLRVERLDLVQFHWWDYRIEGWLETAGWLAELRDAGKIRLLGATNFDASHLRALVDHGIELISHQVQYSLLDRRPASAMAAFCQRHGIHLFCYGTLAGGFLNDLFLDRPVPTHLENRSLVKYRLMIDEFGGWARFQQLLQTLDRVATKHRSTIANIALRWALDQPGSSCLLVGMRSGQHLDAHLKLFDIQLDEEDHYQLAAILALASSPAGGVYAAERQPGGRHAAIMRYDLNQMGESETSQ